MSQYLCSRNWLLTFKKGLLSRNVFKRSTSNVSSIKEHVKKNREGGSEGGMEGDGKRSRKTTYFTKLKRRDREKRGARNYVIIIQLTSYIDFAINRGGKEI